MPHPVTGTSGLIVNTSGSIVKTKEKQMRTRASESGFSLIELIVSIAVTLVVTGAVYGLLASGQNAFRREPQLSDRQQNIRLAMDMIARDLASTGEGMPAFLQTFGRFKNGAGAASTLTACTECPGALNGEKTDELEVVANPSNEDLEGVCGYSGSASHIRTNRDNTNFQTGNVVIVFFPNGAWTLREIVAEFGNNGGPGTCTNGEAHADLSFRTGDGSRNVNVSGGLCANGSLGNSAGLSNADCEPNFVGNGQFISYRIRNGADGIPNLERRSSGTVADGIDFTSALAYVPVARGVEDLQVEYAVASAPDTWLSTSTSGAPQVVLDNYSTLIVKVRVTLSARATGGGKLQGQRDNATLGTAVRGQLTQTMAMRAALRTLQQQPGTGGPGQPTPLWN
jgi:prepilin-type N-terminal cleavage/methylation domain-containing protein